MTRSTKDPARPIKIIHVVGAMRPGGVESWLMRVLRSVDRERYAMDFLVHTEDPCDFDQEIGRLGGKMYACRHLARPWRYARDFQRIIGRHGPFDVIHSHVFLYSGVVLALARCLGVPIRIAHLHTTQDAAMPGTLRSLYRTSMEMLIARNATTVLANSRSTLRSFHRGKERDHDKDRVIYPLTKDPSQFTRGIDRGAVRRLHGIPTDRPAVIYVARFAPLKNHAQMIRVADALRSRGIAAHFVMVGSHGDLLENYRQLARARDDLTILTGFDDVTDLLSCADLCFFPSLKEGFGIAAYEAAAAGLPIVASDLPGLREAIPPAYHRFMIPPGDDDAALEHIVALLRDEPLRTSAALESSAWLELMVPQNSIETLLSCYRTCRTRRMRG